LIQWVDLTRPEALCVYCRQRPLDPAWRPFCSERCKLADLGRWLREEYRVPDDEAPAPDDSERPGDA
jgi:endogenous inhibitor of DNA gyrase (YacG/DUF329 family)